MAGQNDERSPLLRNGQANGHEDRDEEVIDCSGLFLFYGGTCNNTSTGRRFFEGG